MCLFVLRDQAQTYKSASASTAVFVGQQSICSVLQCNSMYSADKSLCHAYASTCAHRYTWYTALCTAKPQLCTRLMGILVNIVLIFFVVLISYLKKKKRLHEKYMSWLWEESLIAQLFYPILASSTSNWPYFLNSTALLKNVLYIFLDFWRTGLVC